jgi:glycosyltransferase involved in cell wall biosynthesis
MMREPRHILMMTDAVGGVWVYATALAASLVQRGLRVTLVTLGPRPQSQHFDLLRSLPAGVELIVTGLALEWLDPEGHDIARARAELLRIADRVEPDLVHLNGFREGAFSWPCPAIVVAHSCVLSWWDACKGGETLPPQWKRYGEAVAAGLTCCDAWVATTSAFADVIHELYRPPAPARVIHNGSAASPRRMRARQPVILGSGRVWDEGKNLAALASIARELPWPVCIAGSGAVRAGDHADSKENVRWLGEIPHAELQQHMHKAAIYAAPARYEPFGLGILEAACAGCALVLSDIATLRELWDGAALFVQPGDNEALRSALTHLCEDSQTRERLQHQARERASRYRLDGAIAEYLSLYRSVLNEPHRPARIAEPRLEEARP